MTKRFFLFLILMAAIGVGLAYLLHGRHSTKDAPTVAAGSTIPSTPITLYWYQGAALVPKPTSVPGTQGIAQAALLVLMGTPPPPGFATSLPTGPKLDGINLVDGTATVELSTPAAVATRRAQAQFVYTLTAFPTIKRVQFTAPAGPIKLTDAAGNTLDRPVTRDDYSDLLPSAAIYVETPERDSTVTSPVHVSGTASVYEASFVMEVWSGGKLLRTEPITASEGAPETGTWSTTVDLPPGPARLVFYEPSAQDGSHLHTTAVALTVKP